MTIFLGNSLKAKQYVFSTAAYIHYDRNNMPPEEVLVSDLENMIHYYEEYIELKNEQDQKTNDDEAPITIKEKDNTFSTSANLIDHIYSYITSKGFYYPKGRSHQSISILKIKTICHSIRYLRNR